MNRNRRIIILATIVCSCIVRAQGADQYTDGNRPYEFGFSIDGEQHRHEKKDERGLIQGEFGFITADGVYHVTVYATDEEGRFKILSMKNIRVKPYPTYTAKQTSTSVRQGHSLERPASSQTSTPPPLTTTFKPISIEPPAKSCSSCSLPTTSTPAPILPFERPFKSNPNQIETVSTPTFPQALSRSSFIGQPNGNSASEQRVGNGTPQNVNYPTNSQKRPQLSLDKELLPPRDSPNSPRRGLGADQNQPARINIPQGNVSPPVETQGFPREGFGAVQTTPVEINGPQESLPPPQDLQEFPQQIFSPGQSPPDGKAGSQASGFINSLQSSKTRTSSQQSQVPVRSLGLPQILSTSEAGQNFPKSQNVTYNTEYTRKNSEVARENTQNGRTPKRFNTERNGNSNGGNQANTLQTSSPTLRSTLPTKPTLISAQMQIVDSNTDIHRLGPGEREGLPDGVTKDHVSQLLYTFNYTVGFHGHFEEGYTDGVKQGYYFVTGRNGIRTRVDYTADSKGFHPKISQEVLDLLSDDVPKPETEKEEKYGLKGYEFKWLYYPVEAKGR